MTLFITNRGFSKKSASHGRVDKGKGWGRLLFCKKTASGFGSPIPLFSGFTLIEVLLVVLIMMIASALAVPSFVRSYRGAKLRASVRSVVMIHRHARSMAVLGQKQIGLLFDVEKNTIEVVSVKANVGRDDRSMFLDERARSVEMNADQQKSNPAQETGEEAPPATVSSELTRALEEKVRITAFESEKADQEYKGIYWVNYYPNGMCDAYSLKLEDEYKKSVTVKVDPISGKPSVENE